MTTPRFAEGDKGSKLTTTNAHDVLENVIAALIHQLNTKLIALVLFGSRARGEARPDSD